MGAVTYSNDQVIQLLNDEVVAVQLPYDAQPQSTDYNVKWTPALFVIDPNGLEHDSTVGFMPPEELIPFVLIGLGKAHADFEKFDTAQSYFERVIDEYPRSVSAPEAVYMHGVTKYKMTHEVGGLVEAYDQLMQHYPSSEWARRAEPYKLLKTAA